MSFVIARPAGPWRSPPHAVIASAAKRSPLRWRLLRPLRGLAMTSSFTPRNDIRQPGGAEGGIIQNAPRRMTVAQRDELRHDAVAPIDPRVAPRVKCTSRRHTRRARDLSPQDDFLRNQRRLLIGDRRNSR